MEDRRTLPKNIEYAMLSEDDNNRKIGRVKFSADYIENRIAMQKTEVEKRKELEKIIVELRAKYLGSVK